MKILIIDDDEVTLQAIEIKLKKDGFVHKVFTNVNDALNILESFHPDLIITDILMPHTSGLELIGMVRSHSLGRRIPIIVLSGIGQEKIVLEAFQLGADDFITKPFNPSELSLRIKKILNLQISNRVGR